MAWLESLSGRIVGIDTAPLIYFIEEHPTYLATIVPFFEALDRGDFQAVTSTVTLLEVLVHPLRSHNISLASQYREVLLSSTHLVTLSLSSEIAELAARLRAEHNLTTPDAIQLATSIYAGATYFFSNDSHLPTIPNLQLLILDNLKNDKS